MLEAGKKLQERYRIEEQVGQGGMGSVYLATDERFNSTVAIKEALFADENYRKAFAREARLLNSLKHSALPKVTDHFVEDNGQYIVMEYIGGDDLFEMMRDSGRPFELTEVLEWAKQLIDALSYLHDQGIIHRDIKPQNLKLTPQRKIILLDFGLAKGNPTDANYQTAAKSIFGYSRNYASLEQIQGTGTDPRSDVYSLAATIYHLLTDRVPADALTRVMMVLNENKDPLEAAGAFNSEISQEISDALGKCLSLKAADRPQDVAEMKAALFSATSTPYTAAASAAAAQENDELLTMNTKLIDRTTGDKGRSRRSEMKTELLGGTAQAGSVQTQVLRKGTEKYAGGSKTSRSGLGSRLGMASAAGIIALVVGGVAAMVYFWPLGGSANEMEPTNQTLDSGGTNIINSNVDNAERSVEALGNSASDELPESIQLEQAESDGAGKASTAKKTTKVASASTSTPKKVKPGSDKVPVFQVDGMTIRGNTIETEEGTVTFDGLVIEKTPTGKQPPPVLKGLPISPEQFRKLSPAQRKRVRDAIEQERLKRKTIPPTPRPTESMPPPPR